MVWKRFGNRRFAPEPARIEAALRGRSGVVLRAIASFPDVWASPIAEPIKIERGDGNG